MNEKFKGSSLRGQLSFVNYEKQFATIDYLHNGKEKTVNFNISAQGKKPQHYRIGDTVEFQLKLSDRGDKMTAHNIKFLYNSAIKLLIQRAAIENRFSGYLKKIGEQYFVKEWESYIFFPLQVSPWEKPPVETADNEAISFSLLNLDKPNGLMAELFSHNFIPEYRKAIQHFGNKIEIEAIVYKVSPHAVYLNLFNDKVQAKLPSTDIEKDSVKEGDIIPVLITYLSNTRIVVKRTGI